MVKEIIYKHQNFQIDAVDAVCNLFEGQPKLDPEKYIMDSGRTSKGQSTFHVDEYGYRNAPIDPKLTEDILLQRIQELQKKQNIIPVDSFQGMNFTTQMETGTGKTYVYIRTIFELNKRYKWTKFIIVVPSIAIREGVKASFDSMKSHFSQDYHKTARVFIYDSRKTSDLLAFVNEKSIQVMIINSQAFNATGKDARRIYQELEEFGYRVPMKVIQKLNPILIIDEPQSVEGQVTKAKLNDFCPLFTLRYSATPRDDQFYNLVYRLDSMDAYNMKLVKSISVVGMQKLGSSASNGYVYLERIETFTDKDPIARIGFDKKTSKIDHVIKNLTNNDNLYHESGELPEYKDNYIIQEIDGITNTVTFLNGLVLNVGDYVGKVDDDYLRRLQIKETIAAHLEKEQERFEKGIKVLSLFFIDEVAKYRVKKDSDVALYGKMFEEEYEIAVKKLLSEGKLSDAYRAYLTDISPSETHAGYFSEDKKTGTYKNDIKDKKEGTSDDVDAYDLIMRDKVTLLDIKKSKVRFIFSHSALREGWDNPNVFQICTLKEPGDSDVRKMQEVGRGLRLCVNQNGERMDESVLGDSVQQVNELTVITSDSYADFAKSIQNQIAKAIGNRPTKVIPKIFEGSIKIGDKTVVVDSSLSAEIVAQLRIYQYIDKDKKPTEKFKKDAAENKLELDEEFVQYQEHIINVMNSVIDPSSYKTKNKRDDNVTASVNKNNLGREEFLELWKKISRKTAYTVDFKAEELVKNCKDALNRDLKVSKVIVEIKKGSLKGIESKESMEKGEGFEETESEHQVIRADTTDNDTPYDLIGEIVEGTGLTRRTVADILTSIEPETFDKFYLNPEEFILGCTKIINQEKGSIIVQKIAYNPLDDYYTTDIFTDVTLKGKIGQNMMKAEKNVYDHVQYDSPSTELPFAEELEKSVDVVVYAKIPVHSKGFKICTPVGNYTPDWVIAFKKDSVNHVYFVAETKGDLSSLQLKGMEKIKIDCARKHFEAICNGEYVYDVVHTFEDLIKLVKG
ncbi:restriction endonuclease [Methanomethylophilus alvi]|uniref:restriction endonuclease n=1 Tax=Methanomethylophilus alvi TaxID=1291540 RepID=UPI0037DDD5C6